MFADLDESIRQLLIQRGRLNSGEVDISFDMPTREWASGIARPTVNVYLYDIRENIDLREPTPWKVTRGPNNTAIKTRPDARVDLTYRITAFANSVEDEHRLLGRVLLTLLQHPVLPEDVLQGEVSGQEISTTSARPDGLVQSPADYWGALDNDIKPAIDYRLTARLNLSQEISVGLVLTSRFRVGEKDRDGVEPHDLPLSFGGRLHQQDDPDAGVPGVKVTLLERALDAVTDKEGHFQFSGVPPGKYTLVVAAPGQDERRVELDVPGESYDVAL